jgi:dipeptidyl-peptidase-4
MPTMSGSMSGIEQTHEKVTFPRQQARTMRFRLGAPRTFGVAPDGSRVTFLRSRSGTDRANCVWSFDVAARTERLLADPAALLTSATEELSAEERARRERAREGGAGVVGYATDKEMRTAAFALSSRLFVADLVGGGARELTTPTPVIDPRPDPTGQRVAYVAGGALRVIDIDGQHDRALAEPDAGTVTWGLAEFVAAEEMGRLRGFWWAPDGERLLAAHVDTAPVPRWHIADPANPASLPLEVAYPAAGMANADVTLALIDLDGGRTDVYWDRAALPYLVNVHWSSYGDPILYVQSRDQRTMQVLAIDTATGRSSLVAEDRDPVWLEVVPGVPAWSPDGRLVRTRDIDGARRLVIGDVVATPSSLQVTEVIDLDDSGVLVSATEEPTEAHVYRVGWDGTLAALTQESGVHAARGAGSVVVIASATLSRPGAVVRILRDGETIGELTSYAETPVVRPSVTLLRAGERELRTALLLPNQWQPGGSPLPVLLDPYGGPGAQRVLAAHNAYLESQWFADQGFAVIVADGRGTPSRGPEWERAIADDLATVVLEDQIDALHAVAKEHPELDLGRVGIRGWSFGGYLSALAVLRRPDVFHAAVAGAPTIDWSLYDTHYTERYLGLPEERPEAYARGNLLNDAERLERPLMIIHGLADDNVVVAHSLRLSSALLAAGRPHTYLPLSGVTHMTPQEVVAENLLLLQVRFLKDALG